MNLFFRKNIRYILFVLSITLFLVTLAFLLVYELANTRKIGVILVLLSSFLTSIATGLSLREEKNK